MSTLHTCSIVAALSFATLTFAQAPQTPSNTQRPSTAETEGTAADRTRPGQTPTQQGTQRSGSDAMGPPTTDPRPSTNPAEGTAADRTPPGQTGTTTGSTIASQQTGGAADAGREIIGKAVTTPDKAPLGKVVDVVFESSGQPTFVVISSGGQSAAVPYSTASTMMRGDTIVMDRARLQGAPKVKEGDWRTGGSSTWKQEASRYWKQNQG